MNEFYMITSYNCLYAIDISEADSFSFLLKSFVLRIKDDPDCIAKISNSKGLITVYHSPKWLIIHFLFGSPYKPKNCREVKFG